MSQYKISKKRLAEIIKEEYQNLQELGDPRRPSPMSYEHEGAADDFRNQVMNLVLKLAPLTLDPKTAAAVEIEIRDVLNTLNIGSDPRDQYRQQEAKKPDFLDLDKDGNKKEPMEKAAEDKDEEDLEEGYMDKYDRAYEEEERERRRQSRRIDRERERNQRSGGYQRPGAGSGRGGIGGGGRRPERFAGFNRDDDELKGGQKKLDKDKDGDIDEKDLAALRAKKKVKKESMIDSIRQLIEKELKNL